MVIKFDILSPPFSINTYYYKNRQRTRLARLWGQEVHKQLMDLDLKDEFAEFRSKFNLKKDALSITIVYFRKSKSFFNANKQISIRSMDLTNIEKPLVDLIFDKRHKEKYDIDTLQMNDTVVCELHSYKRPSDIDLIRIKIEKIPMPSPICLT